MVRPEYCLNHLLLVLFLPNRAQNSVSNPSYNWIQALHRKMCIHKTNKGKSVTFYNKCFTLVIVVSELKDLMSLLGHDRELECDNNTA